MRSLRAERALSVNHPAATRPRTCPCEPDGRRPCLAAATALVKQPQAANRGTKHSDSTAQPCSAINLQERKGKGTSNQVVPEAAAAQVARCDGQSAAWLRGWVVGGLGWGNARHTFLIAGMLTPTCATVLQATQQQTCWKHARVQPAYALHVLGTPPHSPHSTPPHTLGRSSAGPGSARTCAAWRQSCRTRRSLCRGRPRPPSRLPPSPPGRARPPPPPVLARALTWRRPPRVHPPRPAPLRPAGPCAAAGCVCGVA
jgi:hypothetical protein